AAPAEAYELIRRDVIAGIERRRLQPERQLSEVHAEVERAVEAFQHRARLGEQVPLGDERAMTRRVMRSITDLGPLTDLLARADVEEIFVEGARVTFLDTSGRLRGLAEPTTEDENRQILDRLLAETERQLNAKHPLVQARVLDGSARLTAAIPPIADRLSATVRRYTVRDVTLDELVGRDAFSTPAARFLRAVVQQRSRIVISGEPGAGKTTLAAALLAAGPASHCVRCCEEIRELAAPIMHGAYYEVRPPGLDGSGEISLRDLVKFALAMRPDRIVVGEVRGAEAFELTRAINAGCGFICTVHANRAAEALTALVNAALMAGENVTERIVQRVFSQALDLIVHVDRDDARDAGTVRRQVTEITALVPTVGGEQAFEPIFVRAALGRPLEWTGAVPPSLEARIDRALPLGAPLRALLESSAVASRRSSPRWPSASSVPRWPPHLPDRCSAGPRRWPHRAGWPRSGPGRTRGCSKRASVSGPRRSSGRVCWRARSRSSSRPRSPVRCSSHSSRGGPSRCCRAATTGGGAGAAPERGTPPGPLACVTSRRRSRPVSRSRRP